MGLMERLINRTVDNAVDRAVDKTVDKVVDETVGKALRQTTSEMAEKAVEQEAATVIEALLHCAKCGAAVKKEDELCPACGAPIAEELRQAAEQAEAGRAECLAAIENQKEEEQKQTEKAAKQSSGDSKFVAWLKKKNDTKDTTGEYEKADIEQSKILCIFAYMFWLVLIPLFGAKGSKFARFHANQGVILAITETVWLVCEIILNVLLGGVPFLGTLISVIMGLANIVFAALMVVGIINALNGRAKELPFIGKFKILK